MNYKFLFLAIFFFSCKKKEDFSDVKIIGHAASGLEIQSAIFHDNSKEAVQLALETEGCDGVELDVQLSLSNHLWFFHDESLDKETTKKGCIPSSVDAVLSEVEYKTLKKEKLLSLQNLPVNYFQKKVLMLDLRHYEVCKNEFVNPLIFFNEIANFSAFYTGQIDVKILLSNPAWLEKFQELPFEIYYCGGDFMDAEQNLTLYDFDGIVIKNKYISKQQVQDTKAKGKKVIIFELRAPKEISNAFRKHPDFVVTDDLRATIIAKY
jgi:glycerophosphoryl diester phosphodiesterase